MAKVKKSNGELANAAAECEARGVSGMSRRQRRRLLAQLTRDLGRAAPTMAVVKSDPMKALLLIGAEFIARYFPDATSVTFHVTKYPPHGQPGPPLYSVMIPLATPAAERVGSGEL